MAGLASRISKMTRERDFGEAFIGAMDLAIRDQAEPRPMSPNIKPSKAGCLRQMFYILQRKDVDGKETVDPDMFLIQKDGTFMHEVIQKILSEAGSQGIDFIDPKAEVVKAQKRGIRTIHRPSPYDNAYEIRCFNEDYGISFMFDGVVVFMNKKAILEIKNEDHFKFMKRTREEDDHVLQATFYSLCLGLDFVLFLYVGRNYKKRKAYLIEITDEMRNTQLTRVRIAQYCDKHNITPEKEKHKGCRYCSFQGKCKEDGDQTHEGKIDMKEVMTIG